MSKKKRPRAWGLWLPQDEGRGPRTLWWALDVAWQKFKGDLGPRFSAAEMEGTGPLIMVVMRESTFETVRVELFPATKEKEPKP